MKSWIRATVLYPEWLQRLQAELDEVVGLHRVPEFKTFLVYPPSGRPSRRRCDGVPSFQAAINRGQSQFSDPETYNPSRWLEPESQNYKEPRENILNLKRDTAFGWGRRICPGLETAQSSLSIMVATIAWAADIAKAKDSNGRDIDVAAIDTENDSLSFLTDFPLSMQVRDDKRLQLFKRRLASRRFLVSQTWSPSTSDVGERG
ncbi:uncharacterized protein Z519_09033 [Cladophialophora bantiana CBS 173.52]|uniref:Cytochrome P450 n=1 Tax=Cladophialophora bantiana (strain ATCC 10958 / CBS 173.52 / CDC B-1940 / NIH 8579) TaxID=1442370 RepID=A0A0D2HAU4_CLAB1|nr:uncharacterized protein Z519_09033 [Cladophialophora bantiana CBS 173.52]KIW90388.1 hypothetical protein Z519_09033 [Cladophialophora bantiana CBS 173.52]